MLSNHYYINNNIVSAIWFRYIFISYKFIYFFVIKTNMRSALLSIENDLICFNIGFKYFNKINYLFDSNLFFNFLNSNYLVLYTDDFIKFTKFKLNKLLLLHSFTFNGYFINNVYFDKICMYFKFFDSNYLFYQSFLAFFVKFLLKLIYRLKITIILNLKAIVNK